MMHFLVAAGRQATQLISGRCPRTLRVYACPSMRVYETEERRWRRREQSAELIALTV